MGRIQRIKPWIIILICILTIIFGREILYTYSVDSYNIKISFWSFGSRQHISIEKNGKNMSLVAGETSYFINGVSNSHFMNDYFLPKSEYDSIYILGKFNRINKRGIPTKKISDSSAKVLQNRILQDTNYVRIGIYGESLYKYDSEFSGAYITPRNIYIKILGIIPIYKEDF